MDKTSTSVFSPFSTERYTYALVKSGTDMRWNKCVLGS